jgi:hypothetical protein
MNTAATAARPRPDATGSDLLPLDESHFEGGFNLKGLIFECLRALPVTQKSQAPRWLLGHLPPVLNPDRGLAALLRAAVQFAWDRGGGGEGSALHVQTCMSDAGLMLYIDERSPQAAEDRRLVSIALGGVSG